jgi:capsular exopolysaccharide synthesis family protein
MEFDGSKEKSVRDYLRVLFKYKALLIISITIIMSLVLLNNAIRAQHRHLATVKMLLVGTPKADSEFYKTSFLHPRHMADVYTQIIKARTVSDRVVKALELDKRPVDEELQYLSGLQSILASREINELKSQVEEAKPEEREALLFNIAAGRLRNSISTAYDTQRPSIFVIHVRDINSGAAVRIANSVSRSFVIYNLEQQIAELKMGYGEKHSTVLQMQTYVEELNETLDGKLLPDLEALGPANVKILEQARMSIALGGPSRSRLFIAFFASVFLSILLAFIFDFLDHSLKTPQDIEKYLGIPVLCSIPRKKSRNKSLIIESNPHMNEYTRSIRNMAEQIYLMMIDKKIKSLLLIDIDASKDSAPIIGNLSMYLSHMSMYIDASKDSAPIIGNLSMHLSHRGGLKTLVVDADLRNPSLSKIFQIQDSPGLIDVLKEEATFESAITDMGPNLHILPTGKATGNPVTYLDSSKMSEICNQSQDVYDLVLYNCSDLRKYSDAVILSSKLDGAALIINEGKINRQVATRLMSSLKENNVNIIGAILNNRTYVIPKIIYRLT